MNGVTVTKIDLPLDVLNTIRAQSAFDSASVACHYQEALIQTYADELGTETTQKWAAAVASRVEAQQSAVGALRDALEGRWIPEDRFCTALGLDAYQFVALAHVLAGVADLDEQQVIPAEVRLLLEVAQNRLPIPDAPKTQ